MNRTGERGGLLNRSPSHWGLGSCPTPSAMPTTSNEYQREYRAGRDRSAEYEKGRDKKIKREIARRDERRTLVDSLKSEPCSDCRNKFPPECMDFDHVRGQKAFNVSKAVWGNLDNLLAEIAKCDLVCANCHRIRTKKRIHSQLV